jgi:tetratricopeptide (TPR) repeat protein
LGRPYFCYGKLLLQLFEQYYFSDNRMSKHRPLTVEQAIAKAKKSTRQGNFAEAMQIYDSVLKHHPQHPVARKALHKLQKRLSGSKVSPALAPDPPQDQINALINLCNSGSLVTAELTCRELLGKFPQALSVLNILAGTLTDQGKLQEAVQVCNRMIELRPGFAPFFYNRGVALQKLGKFDDAIKSFSAAIELKPDYAQAHSDLALIQLLLGDFNNGWKHHEWRMMAAKTREQVPSPMPTWNGEQLQDKVIFVRAEQGIGDEVMFASCFQDLIKLNPKRIIVECDSRLIPLFTRSFPEMEIQGKRESKNIAWLKDFGNIDYQVAMGSLPMFFRKGLDSFPDRKSFLKPGPVLLEKWKKRLAEMGGGIKIGISWRGGSRKSMKASRSIEHQLWKPVLQSGVHFVNLQYGDCAEDIKQFEQAAVTHIHDWEDANPLTDLDNFAAQISALDLVISIDNSTVHFAGAVGTPTWVLTPNVPDWRWMLEREDSPWYSAVRLFRQNDSGNWPDVISEVKTELDHCFGLQH